MRISDWSSDVCSSDLSLDRQARGCVAVRVRGDLAPPPMRFADRGIEFRAGQLGNVDGIIGENSARGADLDDVGAPFDLVAHRLAALIGPRADALARGERRRSEEHTSQPQSQMRTSYGVFCLNKT